MWTVACVKALRLQGGARRGMDGKAGLRRRRARKRIRTIDADDGALEDLQTRSVRIGYGLDLHRKFLKGTPLKYSLSNSKNKIRNILNL